MIILICAGRKKVTFKILMPLKRSLLIFIVTEQTVPSSGLENYKGEQKQKEAA